MARVFTIAPGLENMGGLKTGGQGSLYKGKRVGEIITAIKILPTPIHSESSDDQNYRAFSNEVAKLKKVNETPSPYIVKFLSSGITEAGNFPYIEMEFIEGPDLEELLQAPNNPIFTIQETIKVAEQLASALAHCHKLDVRHGDIKSNNVKFNSHSGNYVLLDFGLAIMSDEQRRNSLRHTGAIEFMAPEQNTGQMLFQTDVYSYGVILYELLAGTVPFPLKDKGESARNEVRLAHMASAVPDIKLIRSSHLPDKWDDQKKQHEMKVPEWLIGMIYKCLEKKPENRFPNGVELYNYIGQQFIFASNNSIKVSQTFNPEQEKQYSLVQQEDLKKQLSEYRQRLAEKEDELKTLKVLMAETETQVQSAKANVVTTAKPVVRNRGVSKASFIALLFVATGLTAFVVYPYFKNSSTVNAKVPGTTKNRTGASNTSLATSAPATVDTVGERAAVQLQVPERTEPKRTSSTEVNDSVTENRPNDPNTAELPNRKKNETPNDKAGEQKDDTTEEETDGEAGETPATVKKSEPQGQETDGNINSSKNGVSKQYVVATRAFLYDDADESTRRNIFITPSENAIVRALNERYGFIYVVVTIPGGQVHKGWLRKRDLKLYSID